MFHLRSAWMMTWVLLLSLWLAMAQGMGANRMKELRYCPKLFFSSSSLSHASTRVIREP